MIEVLTDLGAWPLHGEDPSPRLERAVLEACRRCGVEEGEFSLAVLSDDAIAGLNERYLGHAGPTDVLSFRLSDPASPPLADVYIGGPQALRQAAAHGVDATEELVRLAVHGALHALGLDHPADGESRAESPMYRLQEEIVAESARAR